MQWKATKSTIPEINQVNLTSAIVKLTQTVVSTNIPLL
jgi:hypothetical protein